MTTAAIGDTHAELNRVSLAARTGASAAAPSVRIVHLGLGAFHRAHQAWYTAVADTSREWGIAAFTGRRAAAARDLAPQDGLYTLIERSAAGDSFTVIESLAEAVDGADIGRFVELVGAPTTAIVTMTVTEPGYRLTPAGEPDLRDDAVLADIGWLAAALAAPLPAVFASGPTTALGRLVLGLHARRVAGAGPIAVVSCDNIPDNGDFVARGLVGLAARANQDTADWITANVSFVSTSIDRITPKTTAEDVATTARNTGWNDRAPVVTEPFSDWVLSGEFPAGRPDWEKAGARFVDEIEPFERRKLWLLNGAHTLLAYAGQVRGHATVASAVGDAVCRGWVTDFWDEAARHLPAELAVGEYRDALLERFDNPRIEHKLAQVGIEGVTKLRVRIAPVIRAERAAGRPAAAGARALGSWVAHVLAGGEQTDAFSAAITAALASPGDVVEELVKLIDPELAADQAVMNAIRSAVDESVPAS